MIELKCDDCKHLGDFAYCIECFRYNSSNTDNWEKEDGKRTNR